MVEETVKTGSRRNKLIVLTILLGVIFLAAYILHGMLYSKYERTGDAYAGGNTVRITSSIPGTAVAIFVDNNDAVKEGQLLVRFDRTPYQIAYDQQLAAFSAAVLQVRQLYENVSSADANVEIRRAQLEQAKINYENRVGLVDTLAVSKDEFLQVKNAYEVSKLALKEAETQLKAAKEGTGDLPIDMHPRIQLEKARVREAYYRLARCDIRAPICGYIAQRQVHVGQYVAPAAPLMSIVSCDTVWVDANFQETQLTNIRIGQPAAVTFDIFGKNVKFDGKVVGISSGTGSVFSLIPPQNATGNWIKIVQRVPVRIAIDVKDRSQYPLLLGLSAEVAVDTSRTDLPKLAEAQSSDPVSTTNIFDVDFSKVDELLNNIIHSTNDQR